MNFPNDVKYTKDDEGNDIDIIVCKLKVQCYIMESEF